VLFCEKLAAGFEPGVVSSSDQAEDMLVGSMKRR
jgi:hypothetical protein